MKGQLHRAVTLGRLRYVKAKAEGKAKAGYYPPETDPAHLRETGEDTARIETALAEAEGLLESTGMSRAELIRAGKVDPSKFGLDQRGRIWKAATKA